MKGFIYTLTALMISLVAIAILFFGQTSSFEDSYPLYLIQDRLGYNILNVNGLDIDYDNGIVFHEKFPHVNLSIQLKKLQLFYDDFTDYKINFDDISYLKLVGPINYTQISDNESKIYFDSNKVSIFIYSNCSSIISNYSSGNVNYDIYIYNGSGIVYHLEGNYTGSINCTYFNFQFKDNYVDYKGVGVVEYKFNVSRGILLSNIKYIINYRGSSIASFARIRI